jgi:RHH-type proline utilization regulon transcriptional repressor/proline dehydrogenase/delta 1-pyrroline-5-carboxylate dehydrogenase
LQRAAAGLEERSGEFIHLAVREAGKTIPDAISEVREAVDFLRYYAREAERREFDPKRRRAPLGVVACISPWNFPLAIFLGQTSAALAAGNAVIAKPAEQTPLIAAEAIELLYQAGVPRDALYLLPGDGLSVGAPLVADPGIDGVVFTGSTEVALSINRSLADSGKTHARLIAETGGINAMIIDSTALLEQATADAVSSAFQSAGQRCSACRIVCVQADIADRFNALLAGAMAELKVGDPASLETDVGPLIDENARRLIAEHVSAMSQSAKLIARAPAPAGVDGSFLTPVAFELSSIGELKREVFGPVLHVIRFEAENLLGVVDEINGLGYGLTLGVHTRIDETMNAVSARARVGNVYVNRNQIGAVVGVQPFGGEGLSGTGPKAGGPHYLDALGRACADCDDSTFRLSTSELDGDAHRAIELAAAASQAFAQRCDRRELLEAAARIAGGRAGRVLAEAAALYDAHFNEATMLPGPTGESNILRLRPRGVILCLGGEESMGGQLARALAAGDGMLAGGEIASDVMAALEAAGAPALVQRSIDLGSAVSEKLLMHSAIAGVAFDGAGGRAELARVLAGRQGPICPILSANDPPARFAVERTLTINTTAAGGDVRLLSLAD